MVVTQTPFRMSFFGGGTDMEEYFMRSGGAVLSTTIDKYCYTIARFLPPFFSYRTEVVYARTERVDDVSDIQHPLIKNALRMMGLDRVRLSYEADLPARSGLGTSSSFAVGMLLALHLLKGEEVGRRQLADEAICLERVLCAEAGGWQDQIAAAFGGFNRITFGPEGYRVEPVAMTPGRKSELQGRLMLFFTGFTRLSSQVQIANAASRRGSDHDVRPRMLELVDEAERVLTDGEKDLDDFGRLLDETWRLKRQTGSAVTTDRIDELYGRAIAAGALGGKLLGAGGGGFLVFYVRPERRADVARALGDLVQVPFAFDDIGARVLFDASPEDRDLARATAAVGAEAPSPGMVGVR